MIRYSSPKKDMRKKKISTLTKVKKAGSNKINIKKVENKKSLASMPDKSKVKNNSSIASQKIKTFTTNNKATSTKPKKGDHKEISKINKGDPPMPKNQNLSKKKVTKSKEFNKTQISEKTNIESEIIPAKERQPSKSYLPVNFTDFTSEDKIGGLLENSDIGCAAVNLKYNAIVSDDKASNSCIYYVLQGKLTVNINNKKKFRFEKGDIVSVTKGQSYKLHCCSRNGSKLLMSYSK